MDTGIDKVDWDRTILIGGRQGPLMTIKHEVPLLLERLVGGHVQHGLQPTLNICKETGQVT